MILFGKIWDNNNVTDLKMWLLVKTNIMEHIHKDIVIFLLYFRIFHHTEDS
jgi:hypothetical protein